MGLQSYPIDCSIYFWISNEVLFKSVFSGKVHDHQPDQDGQDPLARQNEHQQTSKDEETSQKILEANT